MAKVGLIGGPLVAASGIPGAVSQSAVAGEAQVPRRSVGTAPRDSHGGVPFRAGVLHPVGWPEHGYRTLVETPTWIKTTGAVAAAAAAGSWATDPSSAWYSTLRKPSWQPPPAAFPLVWTPLYALLAVAGTRALDSTTGPDRAALRRAYGLNLLLNAGWTVLFFRARSPEIALAEIGALNVSNLLLLRRAAAADRLAGAALAPYVAWTVFATCLNAAIVKLNR